MRGILTGLNCIPLHLIAWAVLADFVGGHLLCNFELTAVCEERGTRNSQKAVIKESRMLKKLVESIMLSTVFDVDGIRAGAGLSTAASQNVDEGLRRILRARQASVGHSSRICIYVIDSDLQNLKRLERAPGQK